MITILLRDGFVVTPHEVLRTDLIIRENKVTVAGTQTHCDQVIDLAGKYIIPGFVDVHTHGYDLFDRTAAECMTPNPIRIERRELATKALDLMETRRITSLMVTDEHGVIEGVVHLHDLWETEMI